jgi:hypothetical protein
MTPSASAWALDPWTIDDVRFLPVPLLVGAAYRIPEPWKPGDRWPVFEASVPTQSLATTWRKAYRSPATGDVEVYVAPEDEERLLAALRAAERVILLVALATGSGS